MQKNTPYKLWTLHNKKFKLLSIKIFYALNCDIRQKINHILIFFNNIHYITYRFGVFRLKVNGL